MENLPGYVRRSGGPRSKQGKAVSASNALKSGVYSRQTFLSGEDPNEYENLRQALFDDLDPQTVVEHALADDVMSALWRKFRLERYASSSLEQLACKEVTLVELMGDLGPNASSIVASAHRLNDNVRELGLTYYRALSQEIRSVQYQYPKACDDLIRFRQDHPELDRLMRQLSLQPRSFDTLLEKNELDASGATFWEKQIDDLRSWVDGWQASFECEQKLANAIERIQTVRVYRHLVAGEAHRASCDVSRALHRALDIYYKQRERGAYAKRTGSH